MPRAIDNRTGCVSCELGDLKMAVFQSCFLTAAVLLAGNLFLGGARSLRHPSDTRDL